MFKNTPDAATDPDNPIEAQAVADLPMASGKSDPAHQLKLLNRLITNPSSDNLALQEEEMRDLINQLVASGGAVVDVQSILNNTSQSPDQRQRIQDIITASRAKLVQPHITAAVIDPPPVQQSSEAQPVEPKPVVVFEISQPKESPAPTLDVKLPYVQNNVLPVVPNDAKAVMNALTTVQETSISKEAFFQDFVHVPVSTETNEPKSSVIVVNESATAPVFQTVVQQPVTKLIEASPEIDEIASVIVPTVNQDIEKAETLVTVTATPDKPLQPQITENDPVTVLPDTVVLLDNAPPDQVSAHVDLKASAPLVVHENVSAPVDNQPEPLAVSVLTMPVASLYVAPVTVKHVIVPMKKPAPEAKLAAPATDVPVTIGFIQDKTVFSPVTLIVNTPVLTQPAPKTETASVVKVDQTASAQEKAILGLETTLVTAQIMPTDELCQEQILVLDNDQIPDAGSLVSHIQPEPDLKNYFSRTSDIFIPSPESQSQKENIDTRAILVIDDKTELFLGQAAGILIGQNNNDQICINTLFPQNVVDVAPKQDVVCLKEPQSDWWTLITPSPFSQN